MITRFRVTKVTTDLFRVYDASNYETIADYDNLALAQAHAVRAQQSYEDFWNNRK